MKKILLLLACMMILCAGCAGTEKEPVETEPVTEPTTEPTEPDPGTGGESGETPVEGDDPGL